MNDLIFEFFIDIITRVIPGFIVLALYPDKLFNSVFAKFQNIPILLIPSLIGAAWVIGFAIERATYVPFAFVISRFKNKLKKWERIKIFLSNLIKDDPQVDCFKTENEELKRSFDWFKFNRRHMHKLVGDKIFCRVACAISVFTWIRHPSLSLLQGDRWPLWHAIPLYSLFGTLIFGAAWLWFVIPSANPKSEK